MGHHAVAEKICRQDPAVMLYTPLRTLIYIDLDDRTRFTVDQPSTVFASFAEPAIAEYGVDLDTQLAELLSALGVEATPVPRGGLDGTRSLASRLLNGSSIKTPRAGG